MIVKQKRPTACVS